MHVDIEYGTIRVRSCLKGYEVVIDATIIDDKSKVAFGMLTLPFEHRKAAVIRAVISYVKQHVLQVSPSPLTF